ncbi:MAG: hypothetical protein AAF447_09260, partial [Myxococcota bacterium]
AAPRKVSPMRVVSAGLFLVVFSSAGLVVAQQRQGPPPPPPEAFAACENQEEGSLCAVETPRGEVLEGTCQVPRGERLVCVPENAPPPPRRGAGGRYPAIPAPCTAPAAAASAS